MLARGSELVSGFCTALRNSPYTSGVTLAQRLLAAIGVVTVATTVALGLGVRQAWRDAEALRFQAQFQAAFQRLERELNDQVRDLSGLVTSLCQHDPVVDSALVDLRAGRLDASQRLALSLRVPPLMEAFRLNELVLFTGRGEVLGAGHAAGLVGKVDPALAQLARRPAVEPALRAAPLPLAVEAHCVKVEGRHAVGVQAARHVEHLLARVGASHGIELTLQNELAPGDRMVQVLELRELGGVRIVASQSRFPLTRALNELDKTILLIGSISVSLALVLAYWLSRGLARPIVNLSRQARAVVAGDPEPVRGGGSRELRELAEAFNRAIADLVALRKRLAATERIAARREIARRVAHEIKNPLAPIRAAVETLRRLRARGDAAFDDYFDEATRTVLDEVQRISNIVSEFTRFARLPPPRPSPVDLVEVVRKIVGLHAGETSSIELVSDRCPKLLADRDQMVQVITNLLQNAIEATRELPNPQIRVEVRTSGDQVRLAVRDNGPGVPPELRSRLFEPYFTTKREGTGLGLAIVERIVIEHGGEIGYEDAPGGGATFTVILPLRGPSLLPEAPPNSEGTRVES